MKSLLNITVLVSSVLSILSTSIALFDVPSINKNISLVENGEKIQESRSQDTLKRVYISHDVSNDKSAPVLIANSKKGSSNNEENHINVFGVKVSGKNS